MGNSSAKLDVGAVPNNDNNNKNNGSKISEKRKKKGSRVKKEKKMEIANDSVEKDMDEQRAVGYIMDMSDTERDWKEKEKENQPESNVEKKKEEPEASEEHPFEENLKKKQCGLCEKYFPAGQTYALETCSHHYCYPCIFEFLAKLDESKESFPTCPFEGCDIRITLADLRRGVATFGAEGNMLVESQHLQAVQEDIRQSVGVFAIKMTNSLELFIESLENMVKCPDCNNMFERIPLSLSDARYNDKVVDDKGKAVQGAELSHYLEHRFRCMNCTSVFCAQCGTVPYHLGFTCRSYLASLQRKKCRYCQNDLPEHTENYNVHQQNENWVKRWHKKRLALRNKEDVKINLKDKEAVKIFMKQREKDLESQGHFFVCEEQDCQERARNACLSVTECKHLCGGVRGEAEHFPCLKDECVHGDVTYDDYCNICWTEDLAAAPSLRLSCNHYFHYHCLNQRVSAGYTTPYISFKFANCPLCDTPINHPSIDTQEIRELELIVRDLAVRRLQAEGMLDDPEIQEGGAFYQKNADYGILRFTFYKCNLCRKPYYGGKKACGAGAQEEEGEAKFDPRDLVCAGCSGLNANCKLHGSEYIEFKCRFCCSLATFFCGGLTHFCTPCHDVAGEKVDFADWSTKWDGVVPCPGYEKCPLGVPHGMNGEEFSLGCALCNALQQGGKKKEKENAEA